MDGNPALPLHNEKAAEKEIAIQLLQSMKSCGTAIYETALTSGSGELPETDVDEPKSYKEVVQSRYAA